MKLFLSAGLLALLSAALITILYPTRALDDQLLHLQVRQEIPEHADALSSETAELQALFLAYAQDPILLAKARLAILRYPEIARPILLAYGDNPGFQDVLRRYGEDVLLPIHYFRANEVFTLELMRGMNDTARAVMNAMRGVWGESEPLEREQQGKLTADERGWYAIHFIETEGYDFIGQFVKAPDGRVGWVQTERMLEGINQFFAGGLKGLETKLRRDESIAMGDVGWAAVDVAIGVSAFKILRMGRAGAAAGGSLTFSQRSAAVGAGLWRGTVVGARVVKYGAPAVLAYMAIRHPSVIHSLLADAAEKLGVPVALAQFVGWTLLLLPVILVLRFVLAPLAWVLAQVAGVLRWGGRALKAG